MKRTELYALAWAEPISKLAGRFGLSDRGLAKLCERNHIPLPPRGYWAKVAADKYPSRAPLPRPEQDYELPLKEAAGLGDGPTDEIKEAPGKQLLEALGLSEPSEPKPAAKKKDHPAPPGTAHRRQDAAKPADPIEIYAALTTECERVMSAGVEYQRKQAAEAFLSVIVSRAPHVDATTAQAMLAWARSIGRMLEQKDPVASVIQSISQAAREPQKPLWWPEG